METIHIYHTNDLHSHFEHWPRIDQLLKERRHWHEQAGDEVFIFDIGDHMDRWHPFSEGTRGKGNCQLLNESGYDAVTIGNNEGITLSYDELDNMYNERNFHVLAANLYKQDDSRPDWASPFHVYTTKNGIRLGVIGLTAYYGHFYNLLGWKVTDPLEEIKLQIDQLKDKTDAIVLLSHLGIHDDEEIAKRFPEVDVILGGHTHHIFHKGRLEGETLLAAGGKHGQYIGHITIEFNPETGVIAQKRAVLYDVLELSPVPKEQAVTEQLYDDGKTLLNETVVTIPETLEVDHFGNSALPRLLCQAMLEWCNADCAFLNAGLILKSLPKGPVTKYDLLTICPHPINPCIVELSGRELIEIMKETFEPKWPHLQVKGLGFRGTVMGIFIYEGIEFTPGSHDHQMWVNEKPIDPSFNYKIAVPDMYTFGRLFPSIRRAEHKNYLLPDFLRDLLEWELKKAYE